VTPRLLGYAAASDYTGFHERYLKRLVFEKRIAYVKDKRRVFFLQEDLDRYIASLRVEPRTEVVRLQSVR
jgi:hypothetical protein